MVGLRQRASLGRPCVNKDRDVVASPARVLVLGLLFTQRAGAGSDLCKRGFPTCIQWFQRETQCCQMRPGRLIKTSCHRVSRDHPRAPCSYTMQLGGVEAARMDGDVPPSSLDILFCVRVLQPRCSSSAHL
eukprot:6368743-Amphidinium_carterae.1